MPTDGADFGTAKICFGKAYTMARHGADEADVAECVMRGVERYIKYNGGAPAFLVVAQALVVACRNLDGGPRLIRDLDAVRRKFAGSQLTRELASAAETIGLTAILDSSTFSQQTAAEKLLEHIGKTRCDGMLSYLVRHRTGDLPAGQSVIESIKSKVGQASSINEFGTRMLKCSEKGLPAQAAKLPPVTHSAESLNNEEL